MLLKNYLIFLPGIIFTFILYSLSQGFNNIIGIELLGYNKSPISTAMIAILIGIFIGNIFKIKKFFIIGLDFTQKYILKFGIICLGIQLKPFEFLEFGKIAIPLITICIICVLIVIKLLIKKLKVSTRMAYLISIGSTVCGSTAIMATAPVIKANKNEVSYAIANITLFGILSMLIYPYFANIYFDNDPMLIGLFLGTSIHETSQVAAAGLIYDQQFNSPETLNFATVTKLIRNAFLVIMIPLFAFVYNRGMTKKKNYSILGIFPYFILGFIGMIIIRNIGDQIFISTFNDHWVYAVNSIETFSKIFLSMAMTAIGLSTNLKDLKIMGFKPFIVGFIAMVTAGIVCVLCLEIFINFLY
ncbi:MAG: putative sulfate exporter family transporter [Pelagibacteraceae bacterium]|nr:putative sulfate exporter family transporter [Pelagibacteraceae bacterium]PHX89694.1 MAG: putative sulfate exporter family transporter [Pelagibacteraceae bacterium]